MTNKGGILRNPDKGFIQDLILRVKLILRLMGDKRVNFFLKLLPVGALIYLVSPIDLIPGAVLPVIGALDDAAVLWLGVTLFVNLCPEGVVQEHMQALHQVVNAAWRDVPSGDDPDDVIDAAAYDDPEENKKP
jgi:uncharacterized membrane protein YkvA (DUF1232 family)